MIKRFRIPKRYKINGNAMINLIFNDEAKSPYPRSLLFILLLHKFKKYRRNFVRIEKNLKTSKMYAVFDIATEDVFVDSKIEPP